MKVATSYTVARIADALSQGKTVVFPTETSYGLGCDATNQAAVDKIFKIKGRDFNKPLLVVVPSIEIATKYLVWNDALEGLAQKYWPGPLTVVGECHGGGLAFGVISPSNTLALRVTAHPFLQSITEKIQRPLVATSANIAGAGECYSAAEATRVFANQEFQPDIILNYGPLPKQAPTTIVSVMGGALTVLRQGSVHVKEV